MTGSFREGWLSLPRTDPTRESAVRFPADRSARGRVDEGNAGLPAHAEEEGERRRCDHDGRPARGPSDPVLVATRRPPKEPISQHEVRGLSMQHERCVGQLVEGSQMAPLRPGRRVDPLVMEPTIDRVGVRLTGMEVVPERDESPVVLSSAERAWTVPRGERGRLVEEEELRESTRLQQRMAPPATETKPTGDPPSPVVPATDAALVVVQAAAVAVDETTGRVGDQLAERRHTVLERHAES
jgi:hypothetical protein